MDFYFTGELNKLKEYIDIDSIPFISSQNSIDKTEFKFFTDTVPEAKEFLTEMIADGNFDPEYPVAHLLSSSLLSSFIKVSMSLNWR